jgi:hypothetical protein
MVEQERAEKVSRRAAKGLKRLWPRRCVEVVFCRENIS